MIRAWYNNPSKYNEELVTILSVHPPDIKAIDNRLMVIFVDEEGMINIDTVDMFKVLMEDLKI